MSDATVSPTPAPTPDADADGGERRRIVVLGAGSWGTTFAKVMADGENDVVMWARRPELAREITEAKRNSDYLPGITCRSGSGRPVARARARRRDRRVRVRAQSDAARQPRGGARPDPVRRGRREPHEGRREGHRPPDERGDRRGPGDRPGAHRRGVRAEPRARDRPGAADRRRGVVGRAGHRRAGREDRPQLLLPLVREHGRDRHRVRRGAQEPHRRGRGHRRRRRLRRATRRRRSSRAVSRR